MTLAYSESSIHLPFSEVLCQTSVKADVYIFLLEIILFYSE